VKGSSLVSAGKTLQEGAAPSLSYKEKRGEHYLVEKGREGGWEK